MHFGDGSNSIISIISGAEFRAKCTSVQSGAVLLSLLMLLPSLAVVNQQN